MCPGGIQVVLLWKGLVLSMMHEVLCERKKGQSIVVMSQNVHFMAIGIGKSSRIHS